MSVDIIERLQTITFGRLSDLDLRHTSLFNTVFTAQKRLHLAGETSLQTTSMTIGGGISGRSRPSTWCGRPRPSWTAVERPASSAVSREFPSGFLTLVLPVRWHTGLVSKETPGSGAESGHLKNVVARQALNKAIFAEALKGKILSPGRRRPPIRYGQQLGVSRSTDLPCPRTVMFETTSDARSAQ